MEDGVEVRSMEELRDNFHYQEYWKYFNDGRLVTWLQDRYENTIAEEIAAINPNEEDVEKKICEVLDVKYDENTSEEEGMAEERKRKLELLKEYPDAMKYAKNVDYVALIRTIYTIYLMRTQKKFICVVKDFQCRYLKVIQSILELLMELRL